MVAVVALDRFSCLGNVTDMVTCVFVVRVFRGRQSFVQDLSWLQQVALLLQLQQ